MLTRVRHPIMPLITFLLLAVTSGTTRADQMSEDKLLSTAKSASEQSSSEVQALEAKALAAVDADAERQDKGLALHLRSGDRKLYTDRPECMKPDQEEKCERYSLIAHARTRGVFVLAKLSYEGLDVVLVNDSTAEETVLPSFPIFSPSGQHLLVLVENDPALSFVIQIWRRDAARFVLDWSGSPNADGYVSYKMLRWPSEDIIKVQSETSFGPPKPNLVKRFTLRRKTAGWQLVDMP
jgi:hypothetical protein